MVSPAGYIEKPRTPEQAQANADLYDKLVAELANPDLDDLMTIVELIVTNEAPHIMALGKRLMVLLKLQQNQTVKSATKKPRVSSKSA